MIDKDRCYNRFTWNPSICECKAIFVWQYSIGQSCLCIKELISNSVEECSENIDRNELIYNETLNDYGKVCNSCTIYIVLLVIYFLTSISAFIYFYWHLKKK